MTTECVRDVYQRIAGLALGKPDEEVTETEYNKARTAVGQTIYAEDPDIEHLLRYFHGVPKESIEEILTEAFVEHLFRHEATLAFKDWYNKLIPDGKLIIKSGLVIAKPCTLTLGIPFASQIIENAGSPTALIQVAFDIDCPSPPIPI